MSVSLGRLSTQSFFLLSFSLSVPSSLLSFLSRLITFKIDCIFRAVLGSQENWAEVLNTPHKSIYFHPSFAKRSAENRYQKRGVDWVNEWAASLETLSVLCYSPPHHFSPSSFSSWIPGLDLPQELGVLSFRQGPQLGGLFRFPSTWFTLSCRQSPGSSFVYENDLPSPVPAREVN